jgi:hypothetical protein
MQISTRSWVSIAAALAHALLVRFSLVALEIPSVERAIDHRQQPYVAAQWAAEVLLLTWLAWPIVLWWLVDSHRKIAVPVTIFAGLFCLGTEAVFLQLYAVASLVIPGPR